MSFHNQLGRAYLNNDVLSFERSLFSLASSKRSQIPQVTEKIKGFVNDVFNPVIQENFNQLTVEIERTFTDITTHELLEIFPSGEFCRKKSIRTDQIETFQAGNVRILSNKVLKVTCNNQSVPYQINLSETTTVISYDLPLDI